MHQISDWVLVGLLDRARCRLFDSTTVGHEKRRGAIGASYGCGLPSFFSDDAYPKENEDDGIPTANLHHLGGPSLML